MCILCDVKVIEKKEKIGLPQKYCYTILNAFLAYLCSDIIVIKLCTIYLWWSYFGGKIVNTNSGITKRLGDKKSWQASLLNGDHLSAFNKYFENSIKWCQMCKIQSCQC